MSSPVNDAARAPVLDVHCRDLRLPAVRRQYPELVRQAAHDGWDYGEFLLQLLEAEFLVRRDGAVLRLLRGDRFPDLKALDQLDRNVLHGIERPQLAQLATCEYIERGMDVMIAGPIGTGKTHLALALGVGAVQRYLRVALLIVDELGFVNLERAGGELLFNLLADRSERHSTFVTTDLAFSERVQVLGDETLTTTLLDHLGHHIHILKTNGQSYQTPRGCQATRRSSRREVRPSNHRLERSRPSARSVSHSSALLLWQPALATA